MQAKGTSRCGFAWLELLLVLALLVLSVQVFPLSFWTGFVSVMDLRNWSREMYMSLNVAIVLILCGMQLGPDLFDATRKKGNKVARGWEKQKKQPTAKEERALYERMREARKRQVI